MAPGLVRGIGIGLRKSLSDRRGDHCVLAFGDMGQRVSDPMDPAPLGSGAEHPRDDVAQAVMGMRDHQLDTLRPRLTNPLRKPDQNGSVAAIYPAFDATCAAGLDEVRGSAANYLPGALRPDTATGFSRSRSPTGCHHNLVRPRTAETEA